MKNTSEILKEVFDDTVSISDDTERIKAIILNERYVSPSDALRIKYRIAAEWDRIEKALHYESFWTFINPNPNCPRYSTNRMNFIFEILLQCEKDENGEFIDINEKIKENPHYIFERCLPKLQDEVTAVELMENTAKIPFIHCDKSLIELLTQKELYGLYCTDELSGGMLTLWVAVDLLFQRLWDLFSSTILSQPQECIVKEKGRSGAMHICYLVCESKIL